jgi:hypothetical protein
VGWQEEHNVKRPSGFFNVDIRSWRNVAQTVGKQQRTRHEALCGDDSVERLLRLDRLALRRTRSFG